MLAKMDIFVHLSYNPVFKFLIMEGKGFWCQKLIWVMLVLGQLHGYNSCIMKERMALLDLKQYLIFISEEFTGEFVLPTWTNKTKSDCCLWEGVKCNRTSGRVIGIATGETYFKENSLLDISLLHPFEEVRSLDLSWGNYNQLSGFFDDVLGYESLRALRNLEFLDLSVQRLSNSIFPFLNAATSLTTLSLRDNYMGGPFPFKVFTHMKKLKALDLSGNYFSSSMELKELKNLTHLEVLSLAWNHFEGPIPIEVYCELKNLRELDLKGNYFVGQVPPCFGSLNKLRVLDLSSNGLSGNLPSSFNSLESLEYLSLADNNFQGLFSLNPLTNLTKLKVFELSSPYGMVKVETGSTWQPKFQLSVAMLPFCGLENIPNFLIYQKKLRLVDLSSNRLSGDIPTWLLENNPELEVLLLQNNSFTIFQMSTIVHNLEVLDFSENDIGGVLPDNIGHALPSLLHMNGSHNRFQGSLPLSMGELKNILVLDLSYNNLSGELPRSFFTGCFSLEILNLYHNKFSGRFLPRRTNFTALSVLRVNNNLFTGEIGVGLLNSTDLSILDMSNNYLTGAIPSWISELDYMHYLFISNNFLEGTIPPSLLNISFLSILDLSGNLLSGALPSHIGSIDGIRLFLHDNKLTGSIPDTLLENAIIVDLRNNKLSGSIPEFVNAGVVSILLLRGNNLTGSIPRKLCELSNIRLLDLSNNKLNGSIPSCLYNLSTRLEGDMLMNLYSAGINTVGGLEMELYKSTFLVDTFQLDYFTFMILGIKFAAKQRYDSYTGSSKFTHGILDYMYGMDLSSNELSGVIPAELGGLSKLRAMNLSNNVLSSSIPDSFSNLKDIESLDLSYNMLHGSIPHQLTNLTSLAVFNVSYNNLSGIIPQGVQFNTFNEDSYLGNPLLCGPPVNRSCEAKKNSEETDDGGGKEEDEDVIDMFVFYWSSASTYVAALIGLLVLMCFDCPWRRAWLCLVDTFIVSAKSTLSFSLLYIPM